MSNDSPLVVGIVGSLGAESVTRLAVTAALEAAAGTGARTELLDLREVDLPMVDPDGPAPADAEHVSDRIEAADALLLGTPMYNGSYSSPLKTAIDHSNPDGFAGTPVGLVAVSGGQFPRRALDHLRAVATHMDAEVLTQEVAVPESYRVEDDLPGDIADRLADLGDSLAAEASVPPAETCVAAPADD